MKQQLEDLVREMRRRGIPYEQAVDEFKKAFLCTVLRANNGNQSKSAQQLGVHRNTLDSHSPSNAYRSTGDASIC